MQIFIDQFDDLKRTKDIRLLFKPGYRKQLGSNLLFDFSGVVGFVFEIQYKNYLMSFFKPNQEELAYQIVDVDKDYLVIKNEFEQFHYSKLVSVVEEQINYCDKYEKLIAFS